MMGDVGALLSASDIEEPPVLIFNITESLFFVSALCDKLSEDCSCWNVSGAGGGRDKSFVLSVEISGFEFVLSFVMFPARSTSSTLDRTSGTAAEPTGISAFLVLSCTGASCGGKSEPALKSLVSRTELSTTSSARGEDVSELTGDDSDLSTGVFSVTFSNSADFFSSFSIESPLWLHSTSEMPASVDDFGAAA